MLPLPASPLSALESVSNDFLETLFESVTWVVFRTDSFSKCNFEILPSGSVSLTRILNGDTGLETLGMIRHFLDFDIEQGDVR